MSKLIFLLCVASIIKAGSCAINYNYISAPDEMTGIATGSDSRRLLQCVKGFCMYATSDLVQKISTARERFEAVYNEVVTRMAYLSLSVQNNLYDQKSHLDNVTRDIFWEEFHRENKIDQEIPITCRSLAAKFSLSHERNVLRSCWDTVQDVLENPPRKHLLIYRDVLRELTDLSSKAYKCSNSECDEIQTKLDNLDVSEKLKEVTSLLHSSFEKLVSADESFERCIQYDKSRLQFRKNIRKRTNTVLRCIKQKKTETSSETNPPKELSVGVHDSPNLELLSKTNAAKANLQKEWREFCRGSSAYSEQRLDSVNKAVPKFVAELNSIFTANIDGVAESFAKRENAEECFPPIEKLQNQIREHDLRVSKCQLLAVIGVRPVSTVSYLYDTLLDKVSKLDDTAFECGNATCVSEVEKQLTDLEPDNKMFGSQLSVFKGEAFSKNADFIECSNLYSTTQEFEEQVQSAIKKLVKCVDEKTS